MREYSVNALNKRIVLCKTEVTFDEERNMIRRVVPFRSVWACVEEKRAAVDETITGQKATVTYLMTIRTTDVSEIRTVMYHGKTLEMRSPIYLENPAFMQFEAVENDGTVLG